MMSDLYASVFCFNFTNLELSMLSISLSFKIPRRGLWSVAINRSDSVGVVYLKLQNVNFQPLCNILVLGSCIEISSVIS